MWPNKVKEIVLVSCRRQCCVCHKQCRRNIELHHIVDEASGGESTFENCIPLCFDCHAHAGHYNNKHPRGTKYSPQELRRHRDNWYRVVKERSAAAVAARMQYYEGEHFSSNGFLWREAFAGPPNYKSLETDQREVYWLLILPSPIELVGSSPEDDSTYLLPEITRLQLMLTAEQYHEHRSLLFTQAQVSGLLWPSMTGHHHGDALLEVDSMSAAAASERT